MINSSIDNLRIELNEFKIRKSISVRQGDTQTRTIHISISQAGKSYSLNDCLYAEMLIIKADGNECIQNMVIVGNELQYTWRTQDINAIGLNTCQVRLSFKDHSILTTPEFELLVYRPEVDANVIQSTNEYSSATEQLILTNEYKEKAEQAADNAATSEENAERYYQLSESYTHGTGGQVRDDDEEDNAKAYKEKAEAAVELVKKYENDLTEFEDIIKKEAEKAEAAAESAKDSEEKSKLYNKESKESAELAIKTYEDFQDKITDLNWIQGPQGPQGERGDSGIVTQINGYYTMYVDEQGGLWVVTNDEDQAPQFELDEDKNLYILVEEGE